MTIQDPADPQPTLAELMNGYLSRLAEDGEMEPSNEGEKPE